MSHSTSNNRTRPDASTRDKRIIHLAWALCIVVVAGAMGQLLLGAIDLNTQPTLYELVEILGWRTVIPIVFALMGTLIIARQRGNRVGWLMIVVALALINPLTSSIEKLTAPPETTPFGFWVLLWFDSWSPLPIIMPIVLIPLYFPTGRPPSARWNWVTWLAIGSSLYFVVVISFSEVIGPVNADWKVFNPLGFLPTDGVFASLVPLPFVIGVPAIALAGLASLFVRYRRARLIEREQIKWLLFSGAFFATFYAFYVTYGNVRLNKGLTDLLFVASVLTFPIAIAIAILRYRLYDIDIIIRKTLQYGALTALLALVYFGSIILFQTLVDRVSGEQSPITIVISTLLIAALFTPLRRRIQNTIDHRFFRQKYDAQKVLASFIHTARDETDLDNLTAELARVVGETMQPERVSVWLTESRR